MTLTICHNNSLYEWVDFALTDSIIQLSRVHGGQEEAHIHQRLYLPSEMQTEMAVGSGCCLHLWLQLLWKIEISALRWLKNSWTITYLVVSHQEPRLSTPVHQLEGTLRLCLWLLDAHESVFACVHICVGCFESADGKLAQWLSSVLWQCDCGLFSVFALPGDACVSQKWRWRHKALAGVLHWFRGEYLLSTLCSLRAL